MGVKLCHHSPSPGSAVDAPRSRVEFFLPFQGTTEIEVVVLLSDLHSRHLHSAVLLVNRAIFSDNSALIVELTGPAGLSRVSHFCDEALFLSPRLATIRTTVQQDVWQDTVEELWKDDEDAAVAKLRWRPSRSGGRAWATPSATPTRLQAARRPAAVRAVPTPAGHAAAELRVEGSLGYDPTP